MAMPAVAERPAFTSGASNAIGAFRSRVSPRCRAYDQKAVTSIVVAFVAALHPRRRAVVPAEVVGATAIVAPVVGR